AGISRQALGAIESGAYHPGVAIAIRLARELGESVETLFGEGGDVSSTLVDASWFGDERRPRNPASLWRSRGCGEKSWPWRNRRPISRSRRRRGCYSARGGIARTSPPLKCPTRS